MTSTHLATTRNPQTSARRDHVHGPLVTGESTFSKVRAALSHSPAHHHLTGICLLVGIVLVGAAFAVIAA